MSFLVVLLLGAFRVFVYTVFFYSVSETVHVLTEEQVAVYRNPLPLFLIHLGIILFYVYVVAFDIFGL